MPSSRPANFPPRPDSALSAFDGRPRRFTRPLLTSAPSAAGIPPNTFPTIAPGFCRTMPCTSPVIRCDPMPAMTVDGERMPKNRLTAPMIGSTTARLIHPPTPDIRAPMPCSRPITIRAPSLMSHRPALRNGEVTRVMTPATVRPTAVRAMPARSPRTRLLPWPTSQRPAVRNGKVR
jgi:hypothetical protein